MNSNFQVNRTEICNICGCRELSILARRSDNLDVLICQYCSMGVLELFPNDTALLYGDDYYESDKTAVASGYADYDANSEHGVLWAAEIVKLVTDSGRVLDIGCANGFLLNALDFGYEKFGIEANGKAANFAETIGVKIIGNDIVDPKLLLEFAGYFDVITAIAVFEHIADFKGAVQAALKMLKPDGVLIFEVPLISENPDSDTWFTSSLEHLFYPTEKGLRYLFNNQLNTQMIGGELVIRDYASTFFGMATSSDSTLFRIKDIHEKIRFSLPVDLTPAERRAQLLLKVIHAADSQPNNLLFIHELFAHHSKLPFIKRCLDLWKRDSIRQQSTLDYLNEVEVAKEFNSDLAERWRLAYEELADEVRNEKTIAKSSEHSIALIVERDAAMAERDTALSIRDTAATERDAAMAERDTAIAELYNVYRSKSWKFTRPLRGLVTNTKSSIQMSRFIALNAISVFTFSRFKKGLALLKTGDVSGLKSALEFVSRESIKEARISNIAEVIPVRKLSDGQPLVSVVIPCFNYGRFVVAAIDSILSQTLKNVEIIVVDGGSSDATSIQTLKEIHRPKTRILFRDGRHLVGDNRNFGIAKASGRYICCLDADDTLDPTYLEKAIFYLETYGYDIASTAINFVGAKSGQVDTLEHVDLSDMVSGNHVLTCAVFRKQLWESAGGYFDVGIGKHHVAEDWDFWLRLAAKGARIHNISGEYLFHYRVHESGSLSSAADVRSLAVQKAAILDRNRELLTPEAFKFSAERQSKYLRCDPTQTALALSFNVAPSASEKTLLLAMPFCLVGGVERLLSGLCIYLARHDWRIIVVTTLPQDPSFGNSFDWFKKSSSEIYALPNFLKPKEQKDFINYLMASRKPDCLLNAGSRLIYELLPEIKEANKNLCVIDLLFNTEGHVKSHIEYREFISSVFAENREVFDWLLHTAGWSANQIRKMSSGVDLLHFQPAPRPKFLVDKYDIHENDLVVGFSGRLSEEKGPEIFIEIAKLCQGTPNLRFVLTGAGPMSAVLMKLIELLPTSVKFEFAGLVDDVEPYLALYDVLILPSRLDGRPLVVMEALACGVPVIASNVGALPDLIEDGRNGYLVPIGNARAFAARIRELAGDSSLLEQLKIGARSAAEHKLDAKKAYCEYDIALREIIKTKGRVNAQEM